jgi:hypothetical protein
MAVAIAVELAGHGEQVAQTVDVAVTDPAGVRTDHPEREGSELARLDRVSATSPGSLCLSPTGPGGAVGRQPSVVTCPPSEQHHLHGQGRR